MAVQLNEQFLDEKLAELEKVRNWSPRVVSKLETMIRMAEDFDLFRINPIKFATERNASEDEAVALFLHATKFGMFEMEWHLICPYCGHVIESFRELGSMHAHSICGACCAVTTATLDDYIQVSFTISPQIRDNRFRHPESLSPEDFFLRHQVSKGITTYYGEVSYYDFFWQITRLMKFVEPGEQFAVELDLKPGMLQATDLTNGISLTFMVGPENPKHDPMLSLHLLDGKVHAEGLPTQTPILQVGPMTVQPAGFAALATGKTQFEIKNGMQRTSTLWMYSIPLESAPALLEFEPFLSGKRLLSTQTFRDLFRSEVVQSSEGIGVKDITFLFTDLKGSTALYDLIGDPKAYYLVRQHFDTLSRVIANHSGAIVKTIGDAVMATFVSPGDAVGAAIDMLKDIETFNRGISEKLILKIGIHRGHSIVVTLNDRLDYFGQTVNIAARVQGLAEAGEIYVSKDVYGSPDVGPILAGCEVVPEKASVKGVSEQLDVYKIRV